METVKFTFDTSFDTGQAPKLDEEIEVLLERARIETAQAHERGLKEGREQTLSEIEAATQTAIEQLSVSTGTLFATVEQIKTQNQITSAGLAHTIAKKLAATMMKQAPLAEIEALIEECLEISGDQSRLVVRVNQEIFEPINIRIQQMKDVANFKGDIIVAGDPALAITDARIEWPDGGMERNLDDITNQIEEAIERFFQSKSNELNSTVPSDNAPVETLEVEEVGEE